MAEGSGALHLLLVGRRLGFTSNMTGRDPASSQTDAEVHPDDLAFLAIEKKTTTKRPSSKPQLVSPGEAAVPPEIASAPVSFLFQQRKSMACAANGSGGFLPVDST